MFDASDKNSVLPELAKLGVTETQIKKIDIFLRLLAEEQQHTNLIGPATLPIAWSRHVLDSAQLFPLLPVGADNLLDLGSGAGFPGVILAIMGQGNVTLVESVGKKARFLETVSRETDTPLDVRAERIENITPWKAAVLTARAVAPVAELLSYFMHFIGRETIILLPKGKNHLAELTEAEKKWKMNKVLTPSLTDPQAMILRLSRLHKFAA